MRRPALALPTLSDLARYGSPRRDEDGYWVWPDGRRIPPIAGGSGPALDQFLGEHTTGGSPVNVTSLASVPAHELTVLFGAATGATALGAVSDSASNTYTTAASEYDSVNNVAVLIGASEIATALTMSSVLTYTQTGGGEFFIAGASFTGCSPNAATASYAAAETTQGSGTTISVTSGSVNAGDLAVLWVINHTTTVPSTPTGWTAISTGEIGVGAYGLYYQIPSSTGTLSPSVTIANNVAGAAIVAFPAASATVPYIIGARNTYH